MRSRNTNRQGTSWTEEQKKAVWQKGSAINGYDSSIWRRDKCGHAINYSEHGNTNSVYGWEIDHINPVANGGGDELNNLQPLYWDNNRRKGDSITWNCN